MIDEPELPRLSWEEQRDMISFLTDSLEAVLVEGRRRQGTKKCFLDRAFIRMTVLAEHRFPQLPVHGLIEALIGGTDGRIAQAETRAKAYEDDDLRP